MQLQMWLIHKTCGRIQKETNKTRGIPPIELSHGLTCQKKKNPHLPTLEEKFYFLTCLWWLKMSFATISQKTFLVT
jgi:hypothetical protein